MKQILVIVLLVIGLYQVTAGPNSPSTSSRPGAQDDGARAIQQAFEQRRGDLQVKGQGVVARVLSDDNKGSRHQRFILRLSTGQTVLVAHNIDLAPRISGLKQGDNVQFYGEYEYNDKGGVIHWTHHDPKGRHIGGWLKHNNRTYQ